MRLVLIDGNSVFHRAYHAIPPLTAPDGTLVNAVFGFCNILLKVISDLKPDHIAVCFDSFAPTFRHIEFADYKAQRGAPPPDLYPQMPIVREILDVFEIPYYEEAGYEADDLIATLATQAAKRKIDVVIATGDRDTLQLVNGLIRVWMPGPKGEGILFDGRGVKEKFGITPSQMIDYKAIVGDPSDNVPGVSGIGPKGAADLISVYGSLEAVYKNIDKVNPKAAEKLKTDHDKAFTAKRLVTLDLAAPIKLELGKPEKDFDWTAIHAKLTQYGFRSIIAKLPAHKDPEIEGEQDRFL